MREELLIAADVRASRKQMMSSPTAVHMKGRANSGDMVEKAAS